MNKSDLFTAIFVTTVFITTTLAWYWRRLYWNTKIGPNENRSFFHNWLESKMYPNDLIVVKDSENQINAKKTYLVRILDFATFFMIGLVIIMICFTLTYIIVYKLL